MQFEANQVGPRNYVTQLYVVLHLIDAKHSNKWNSLVLKMNVTEHALSTASWKSVNLNRRDAIKVVPVIIFKSRNMNIRTKRSGRIGTEIVGVKHFICCRIIDGNSNR
jgi:hypothetical protein